MRNAATSVRASIGAAGLLFQPHPGVGAWEATRAVAPELVAFTNTTADPTFRRLRVVFHAAGETDADGYTYETDHWQVEYMDMATHTPPDERDVRAWPWAEPDVFTDRDAMVAHVVAVLEQVTAEREP